MVWIDYAILAVIGLSVLISLVRGFAREAMSLVVWVLAFLVSSRFYEDLAVYLSQIDDPMLRNGAAISILFVATLILGGLLNYLIGQMVDRTGLTGTDRVLGVVFGAARGALVVAAVLFFLDSFTGAASSGWWHDSVLIPEFKVVIQWFFQYLEQSSSFLPKI
ncbi:membrane protein required for colicin V production [Ferrimonas sediminum]|uniref:Membrane protein required for colicin V production n=1 Tax=Ferrimonas sediminum TaxID=718193 RepID=A0A1G8XWV2_9GAMM|nr:CvpA family protein [Ferrimonas sediminum]SDJ94993.1 membrane protein required for colicin V production [Ferrimonas sediminum]